MTKLSDYFDEDLVLFLDAENRDQVLWQLIDQAVKVGKIDNRETFFTAISGREKIVSTGIGMGVALPHAKISGYKKFFIVVGRLTTGVNWKAIDDQPVRLVLMIGGPDDQQTEYLQLLSSLTKVVKDEVKRKKILTEESLKGMIKLFRSFDD